LFSVIAHRGASTRHRENTVEAFRAAARLGADGVELDVRRCADGALVVHHDATLPTGEAIVNLKTEEIPAWAPLLPAALEACGDLLVNIEIKNAPDEADWDPTEAVARAAARLVQRIGRQGRTLLSSFTIASIDAAKQTDPTLPTALLTLPFADQDEAMALVKARGHQALNPHHAAVSAELTAKAHAQQTAVYTWTVDDPDRMRWLAQAGVDGIITNVPDLALETRNALRQ
jgi:glycerophosphoryl diester phosphodiesterase